MLLSAAGQRAVTNGAYLLKHPSARKAYNVKQPPFLSNNAPHFNDVGRFRVRTAIATQTARGGQAVEVNSRSTVRSLHGQACPIHRTP